MVLLGKITILQGVGHQISCLGVCYANDPKKGGYTTLVPALDLTTSLRGDFQKIAGKLWENCGKLWENCGEIVGKLRGNCGEIVGKFRKISGKWRVMCRKIAGKLRGNCGECGGNVGNFRELQENSGKIAGHLRKLVGNCGAVTKPPEALRVREGKGHQPARKMDKQQASAEKAQKNAKNRNLNFSPTPATAPTLGRTTQATPAVFTSSTPVRATPAHHAQCAHHAKPDYSTEAEQPPPPPPPAAVRNKSSSSRV